MTLQDDDAAAAAVAVAPRVTLADMEARIVACHFLNAGDATVAVGNGPRAELELLTLCLLVIDNGFTVVGKAAPASPANYNPELGRKFAKEDAMRQLWPLCAFELRSMLRTTA